MDCSAIVPTKESNPLTVSLNIPIRNLLDEFDDQSIPLMKNGDQHSNKVRREMNCLSTNLIFALIVNIFLSTNFPFEIHENMTIDQRSNVHLFLFFILFHSFISFLFISFDLCIYD